MGNGIVGVERSFFECGRKGSGFRLEQAGRRKSPGKGSKDLSKKPETANEQDHGASDE